MDENSNLRITDRHHVCLKAMISIFIVFHWICVIIWMIPRFASNIPADIPGSSPAVVESYLFATGHWQYWNMFAPPSGQGWHDSSHWIEAVVETSTGREAIFIFPRPSQQGMFAASMDASVLKYQHRLLDPQNKRFRVDLAHFLARQVRASGEIPMAISLYHCTMPLPTHERRGPGDQEQYVDYTILLRDSKVSSRRKFFRIEIKADQNL